MSPLDPIVARAHARAQFGVLCGALDLLESADAVARSGGIFALERLARENPAARESVVEILSALVRRRAGRALPRADAPTQARVPGDVQAALAVLSRMTRAQNRAPLDLHGISLRAAFLPSAQLAGALLYDCDLEGALLDGADLRGAWLWRTNLKRVNLDNADLRGADLSGARGLKRQQLETAIYDEKTRLPDLDEENTEPNARWKPR